MLKQILKFESDIPWSDMFKHEYSGLPLCVYHIDRIMEFTDKICSKYNKSSREITFDDLTNEEQKEYTKIK